MPPTFLLAQFWHTGGTLGSAKHLVTLVRRPVVCLDHTRETAGIPCVLRSLGVLWIARASTVASRSVAQSGSAPRSGRASAALAKVSGFRCA